MDCHELSDRVLATRSDALEDLTDGLPAPPRLPDRIDDGDLLKRGPLTRSHHPLRVRRLGRPMPFAHHEAFMLEPSHYLSYRFTAHR